MEELINTDNITLDYISSNNEYRLSLFENYHYIDDFFLKPEQLRDLIENGKKLEITCNDDDL